MSLVTIGETFVKLKRGDITEESTDVIVNLTNASLSRSFGVSRAILRAAGPTVREECARLGTSRGLWQTIFTFLGFSQSPAPENLPSGGCVVTSAGNLQCNHIFHLIDAKKEQILRYVKKVLQTCDERDLTSVSFPAMGTGSVKLDAQNSVHLLMRGIEEYLNDPTTNTNISEIVIVVFEQNIYDAYLTFFKNYKITYYHFSAFGTMIELIKEDITLQDSECLVNLTNNTLNQSSGVSGAILTAAGNTVREECTRIGKLKTDQAVITSGGKLKAKKIMHIIGPEKLPDFGPSIHRILQECNKNGFTSVALPAIGTGLAAIAPEESSQTILNIILNYLSKISPPTLQTISIVVHREDIFTTYLEVFKAKILQLQKYRESTRRKGQVRIVFPFYWTNVEDKGFQEVTLDKDSTEYQTVQDKFLKTALPSVFVVLEIKRIQNVKLWQSFTLKKQAIEEKNPGNENVRPLYHGTTPDAINNINRGGFNRNYHGRNGTACGTGTYFSVGSNYAAGDRYSVPDTTGNKYVYQCSVITGRYCKGHDSYKEPPIINNDPSGDRYDSVVDKLEKQTYFVVFYDDYAYPEYLITFKPKTP